MERDRAVRAILLFHGQTGKHKKYSQVLPVVISAGSSNENLEDPAGRSIDMRPFSGETELVTSLIVSFPSLTQLGTRMKYMNASVASTV